jgi:hypothetical protein
MAYFCGDCSYHGQQAGENGQCPACGSFDLIRSHRQTDNTPPANWRLVLLALFWGTLLLMIIWKLLH